MACALYQPAIEPLVPVSTTEAAELVKLLENTFRSVNIGLVNEMAIVCDKLGVDVWEVIEAAATKPFGFMKFLPGPGLGGHCIPIDPHYLAWKMRGLNYKTRFIDLAGELNTEMPLFWVRKVAEALNDAGPGGPGRHGAGPRRRLQAGHRRHPGEPGARHHPSARRAGRAGGLSRSARALLRGGRARISAPSRSRRETVRAADCVMIVTDHSADRLRDDQAQREARWWIPATRCRKRRDMHVAVVGSGYVGLVAGACLAETGNDVICVDKDADKIARLQRNEIPIYEPGLEPMVQRNQAEGRLTFTTDIAAAVKSARVIFIAVGTPPGEDGSADLQHVLAVAREIGRHMNEPKVVVTKSTVPVGTAEKVRAAIGRRPRSRSRSAPIPSSSRKAPRSTTS